MQAPVQGNVTWQRTTFSEVESGGQQKGLTPDFARTRFRDFIRHFAKEGDYIYRDQLRQNYHVGRYHLNVEIEHIQNFDEDLAQWLISQPGTVIPFVCLHVHFNIVVGTSSKRSSSVTQCT
jgi:DNA replication licensing factor MCM5